MIQLLRKAGRVLLSNGPLIPNEEADDETPTLLNVIYTLGLLMLALSEPGATPAAIGASVIGVALTIKFAFNYWISTEQRPWSRTKFALWILLYHPLLGRPFRVISMIRESETRAELAGSIYCATLFYAFVVICQLAFPLPELFGN